MKLNIPGSEVKVPWHNQTLAHSRRLLLSSQHCIIHINNFNKKPFVGWKSFFFSKVTCVTVATVEAGHKEEQGIGKMCSSSYNKGSLHQGGGHWGALHTAIPQKILPDTASPQEKSMEHRHRNM